MPYQRVKFMFASADQASVDGLNVLVRVSNGLPPDATIRPSSSVVTPAQNMSWKLLSTVWNVSAVGSNTAACVSSRSFGNESVSVDDHVSTRPSGIDAAVIAMCGHAITGLPRSELGRVRRTLELAVRGDRALAAAGRRIAHLEPWRRCARRSARAASACRP